MTKLRIVVFSVVIILLAGCTGTPTPDVTLPVETATWTPSHTPLPTSTIMLGTINNTPTTAPVNTTTAPLTPIASLTASPTANPRSSLMGRFVVVARGDIYLIDAFGQDWTRLTNTPQFEQRFAADIPFIRDPISASPDGSMIAFAYGGAKDGQSVYEGWDICVIDTQECRATQNGCSPDQFLHLTGEPYSELSPAWSPDGSLIAYSSDEGSYELYITSGIFVMKPDGSGQEKIIGDESIDLNISLIWPAWSPDGSMITFGGMVLEYRHPDALIFYANADGSNIKQLTNLPHEENKNKMDFRPQWSFNGRDIYFAANREDNACLYRINLDSLQVIPIFINNFEICDFPHSSPDGTKIAFITKGGLYVANPDGSEPILITGESVYSFVWIP